MPVRLPDCRYDDVPVPRASYDDWASTPVDPIWGLPESYVPPDLVPVSRAGIVGGGTIRELVVDDLAALADAADAAGVPLAVQSAYRSHARQAAVFAEWVASSGEAEALRFSARPGHSEHQLGTTLDLRAAAGPAPWRVAFAARPTGRWLAAHSWEFGFVVSYPEGMEARTCYGAEAWHVRYVGRDEAAAVAASGLTLREWLWQAFGPD
jgi:D-alanyl-D-alanine carboxypeptidase